MRLSLPEMVLEALGTDEAISLLIKCGCRRIDACAEEFSRFGVTKFVGHDADGIVHQITIRKDKS